MLSRTSEKILRTSAVAVVLMLAAFTWLWQEDLLSPWYLLLPLIFFMVVLLGCFFNDRKKFSGLHPPLTSLVRGRSR